MFLVVSMNTTVRTLRCRLRARECPVDQRLLRQQASRQAKLARDTRGARSGADDVGLLGMVG